MNNGFILVHTLDMQQCLINISKIYYVNDCDGAAQIFLQDSDSAITCHESLKEVCDLIYDEFNTNNVSFWEAKNGDKI